ncbi:TonB-dependent receptor [Sphingomonas sp. RIT328]|uniref:TonB-dependent receptor n=1 Tax=Sphingomonas sp. RIT328 TaxID=1470591 RepID=UPI000447E247|nr:TonB-dependent receptor [Sphingomonas sp. RIT328]EZP50458.1 TonB-dependent receptor [Sphingomonas sp. RIT328]
MEQTCSIVIDIDRCNSRNRNGRLALRCSLGALALALLVATPALAQQVAPAPGNGQSDSATPAADQPSTDPGTAGDIIVTANKRAEPVQKVAQTVNVVSAATLQNLHVQNTVELSQIVGGLSMTVTSPSEQSISLRGIKEPSGGGPSTYTVETYLNEVPITVFDSFATTLDIGQIEVLKGPQGTLRGRPSPSGAITIATEKGSFTDYSGYAEATVSDHVGRRFEAATGGPVSDTLAFRIAGVHDYNALTEVRNIYNGKRNYQDTSVVRGTLDWRPTDRLSVDVMGQYTRQTGDFYRQITGRAPCAGDAGGAITVGSIACGRLFDLEDKIALTEGANPFRYRGTLFTVNAHYDLTDRIGLAYVGGYNDTSYYTNLNFDFAGVGEVNNFGRYLAVNTRRKSLSNELRLQSAGGGVYNFTYGVFQQHTLSDQVQDLPPLFANQRNRTRTNDYGIFTTQRIDLTARDNIQAGIRFSKVDLDNVLTNVSRSYSATTGNASYQHQFTPRVMAYVSYGTSFRPGSGGTANPPQPGIPAAFGNFDAERSRSIELGLKSQWFDKRLTANLAVFDQKFDGYITSQFNVVCTATPNPNGPGYATYDGTAGGALCYGTMTGNGNAVSRGVELELAAHVTDRWSVGGIYTYTDAHFDNARLPCNDYNGDGILDVDGVPRVQKGQYVSLCTTNGALGSLPKVSFTANTSYTFDVGRVPAYIRLNSATRSSAYFPQTGRTFSGYTIVNGSIGVLSPDRNWELSLWGKNLFNTVKEDTDGGPWSIFGVQSGLRIGTVTNDRELGLTLRRTF